jgi:methionyl aminopeptidase
VHGIPNEDPHICAAGDVVTLDAGLIHAGLITDAAITVCVGTPEEKVRTMLKAAYEALDAGIAAARVGNTIGDIGYAVERVARKYELNYPHELGGHSVGLHVHEEPFVPNYGTPGSGPKLEEGMVLAIEPMFMLGKAAIKLDSDGYTYRTKDGSKAVHVEHTVLITASGPEILTKAS